MFAAVKVYVCAPLSALEKHYKSLRSFRLCSCSLISAAQTVPLSLRIRLCALPFLFFSQHTYSLIADVCQSVRGAQAVCVCETERRVIASNDRVSS